MYIYLQTNWTVKSLNSIIIFLERIYKQKSIKINLFNGKSKNVNYQAIFLAAPSISSRRKSFFFSYSLLQFFFLEFLYVFVDRTKKKESPRYWDWTLNLEGVTTKTFIVLTLIVILIKVIATQDSEISSSPSSYTVSILISYFFSHVNHAHWTFERT